MPFRFLKLQTRASKTVEALLTNNVIGTAGISMLYQHLGVAEKLYRIPKPHIVSVQRNGVVVGTCCFCEREFDGTTGFYIRYFAFREEFRLKQIPGDRPQKKTSVIRAEIMQLLSGKGLVQKDRSFFHYAYVDPRNPRSARLCQAFGFVPVRQYTTRLFSRLWPKHYPQLVIKELRSQDSRIRQLLTVFYRDYQHLNFENLDKTYYYVEDEAGEIIAGVQTNPDAWKIVRLPGRNGRTLLTLFDRMPLLSRLLSKHFRFLAVEGIYCQAGKEKTLEHLLESLLLRYGLHTAIMVTDVDSSVFRLTQKINLGVLDKISPRVNGNVIVRNQPENLRVTIEQKQKPAYISVQDVS